MEFVVGDRVYALPACIDIAVWCVGAVAAVVGIIVVGILIVIDAFLNWIG